MNERASPLKGACAVAPGSDWLPQAGEAGPRAPRFFCPSFRVQPPELYVESELQPDQEPWVGGKAGASAGAAGAPFLRGESAATPCAGPRPGSGRAVPCLGISASPASTPRLTLPPALTYARAGGLPGTPSPHPQ